MLASHQLSKQRDNGSKRLCIPVQSADMSDKRLRCGAFERFLLFFIAYSRASEEINRGNVSEEDKDQYFKMEKHAIFIQ